MRPHGPSSEPVFDATPRARAGDRPASLDTERPVMQTPSVEQPPAATAPVLALNLERVRAEFHEMPGLCLTVRQAVRLLALDSGTCRRVLDQLAHEGFLQRDRDGYRRV